MKIKILALLLVAGIVPAHAAPAASVTVVEAVAVRNGLHAGAKYYYESKRTIDAIARHGVM
ncbi:MAG: hypothetical protein U5K76_01210 [Woeseiaceae bacterium]|nr:hypothetical protein [Woeseiaceae bacterium]